MERFDFITTFKYIWKTYQSIKRVVTIGLFVGMFLLGHFVLAPLLDSKAFEEFLNIYRSNKVLRDAIDIEQMVVDNFVSVSVPLLVVWSCGLVAYHFFRSEVQRLNEVTKYFSFLTGAPGKFLFSLFMLVCGLASYAYSSSYGNYWYIVAMGAIGMGMPGAFMMAVATPQFKQWWLLDALALPLAVLLAVLAILGMVYGVIGKWLSIYQAVANVAL